MLPAKALSIYSQYQYKAMAQQRQAHSVGLSHSALNNYQNSNIFFVNIWITIL